MKPTWISKTERAMELTTDIHAIVTEVMSYYQGIDAMAVVTAINEIERFNKQIHKLEMARMARLAGAVTPYNNSLFMDS
jgi:predicted MarR family transcription regulator